MNNLTKARALFLVAAGFSFLLSVSLWFLGNKEQGIFVLGGLVTIVVVIACVLVGQAEADDARARESRSSGRS